MIFIPDSMFICDRIPELETIMTDFFWKYQVDTKSLFLSESLYTYLGYPPEKNRQNLSWLRNHIHQEDLSLFDTVWNTATQSGTLHAVLRVLKKDSSFDYILFKGEQFGGTGKDIIGTCRNLTQLQNATEKLSGVYVPPTQKKRSSTTNFLSEHSNLFQKILEQTDCRVIITDSQGTICYANSAEKQHSSTPGADLIGTLPDIFQTNDDLSACYPECLQALKRGTKWQGRMKITSPNGSATHEELTIFPFTNPTGPITYYFIRRRDIHHELLAEKRNEKSRNLEALGTLAGGIAHNFNNILMSIMGFTEICQLELPKDNHCQHYLSNILSSGIQGKELVQQILIFSGKMAHNKFPLEIGIIIKEIAKSFQAVMPGNIQLSFDINDKKQLIRAEPTQPYQILTNLLNNAVEAMDSQPGTIKVTLNTICLDPGDKDLPSNLNPGEFLILKVEDTGSGMDAPTRDRVFEPFFIAGSQSRDKTGMGLPIVYGIIQDLDGDISIASEPGKGTVVTTLLPTIKTSQQPTSTSRPSPLNHGHGRILFIDDQPEIVSWAKISLANLGYEIMATTNSTEALTWVKEDPKKFDLVITDLIMPEISGRKIIVSIHDLNKDLPIIICTGLDKNKAIEQTRDLNIQAILSKPLSMAEFSRAIRKALTWQGRKQPA